MIYQHDELYEIKFISYKYTSKWKDTNIFANAEIIYFSECKEYQVQAILRQDT